MILLWKMTLELKSFRLNRGKTKYMHNSFDNRQILEDIEITLGDHAIHMWTNLDI